MSHNACRHEQNDGIMAAKETENNQCLTFQIQLKMRCLVSVFVDPGWTGSIVSARYY